MKYKPVAFCDDAYGPNFLGHHLIEDEEKEPQFTGLLTKEGKGIFRFHPPRPKIGFPIHPEDNDGYQFSPDDYMYVEIE